MVQGEGRRPTASSLKIGRYESLPRVLRGFYLTFTVIGIGVFIFYNFAWNIRGWVFQPYQYYYLIFFLFFAGVFILLPARRKDTNRLPWYDILLAALALGICAYWITKSGDILQAGWSSPPTAHDSVVAIIFCFLAVESGRRLGGLPYTVIVVITIVYPLTAGYVPGMLKGIQFSLPEVAGAFAFTEQGILGLPGQVMGQIVVGYLVFCGMLLGSGAGDFFLNLALGLVGNFRGGPAKVAVIASGFFGSLSGNPIANVVATGSVTIPAMKRLGYPPHYAAAVEACASNGGTIMPPVMGAVAFIIAVFVGVDYAVVMVAATIPAILYYFCVLMQVDAYAARAGLRGIPREELPSVRTTLKKGWVFLAVIAFLVFGLLYMKWGIKAPIYSAALMIPLSFTSRDTMLTPRRFISALATTAKIITATVAMLLPIAFITAGLAMTGAAASFTAQLHTYAGSNTYFLLLILAGVCYVFGLVGMPIIPFIVLATTAAPVLASVCGLNILAVDLFILYWCLTGALTPPVAVLAFIAASVAGAHPMKTAWTAMRLAIVLYFIPFFFVINDSLILQGPILESLYLFALCLVGITFLAAGLEGYLLRVGMIRWWVRPFLVAGGFLIAFPGWMPTIYGAVLTGLGIFIALLGRTTAAKKLIP